MKKVLRRLDSSGDTVIEFDDTATAEDQVKATAEAKALFERMSAAGAVAFSVNRGEGKPDQKISDFRQTENETVIVPKIVGG